MCLIPTGTPAVTCSYADGADANGNALYVRPERFALRWSESKRRGSGLMAISEEEQGWWTRDDERSSQRARSASSGRYRWVQAAPQKVTYPSGREIHYVYEAPPVGRLLSISENTGGTQNLVNYIYLGMNTIMKESHPQVSGRLNLSYGANGTYTGRDRFSRTASKERAIQARRPAEAERVTVKCRLSPLEFL